MPASLRRERGKLRLHRSHVTGRHFTFRGHNSLADRLARQAKRLGKAIKYGPE